jgi:hypothetical protein
MIHLFLDDSGKESQSTNPWVCMAGYLANQEALTEPWEVATTTVAAWD